jgi:hypothetical protein
MCLIQALLETLNLALQGLKPRLPILNLQPCPYGLVFQVVDYGSRLVQSVLKFNYGAMSAIKLVQKVKTRPALLA